MGGSGGAATNAGIDFQQRVAALVVAQIAAGLYDFTSIQLGSSLDIKELRFEAKDYIDDLVIVSHSGRALIQAKRSLSLSSKIDSEYSSVIGQFVGQHLLSGVATDSYVIATSSKSSRRIKTELKKITEALRLNEDAEGNNPFTKSELDVYETTKSLIEDHYLRIKKQSASSDCVKNIIKKVRVAVIDIEEGTPLEAAILTVLSTKSCVSPDLVWASIISLCISLSKDRLTIDKAGIESRIGKYFKQINANEIANEYFRLKCEDSISAGRDCLVVKSFVEACDYLVVELYRFDDDGAKRLKFYGDKVELLNGETWTIIHRAATFSGIERYLEESSDITENTKVAILPINSEKDIESEPFARSHADYLATLTENSQNPLNCLHCGDPVSKDLSPFVEIDDEENEHAVGVVHSECLHKIDRVLGQINSELFSENKLLESFDYSTWFAKSVAGQGLFSGLANIGNRVAPIAWKPDYNNISRGPFCVRISLEDGSARYVHERGKVVRHSEEQAQETADFFNECFDKARKDGDPWCYTSEKETFGPYSTVLELISEDEICVFCSSAEPAKYTRSIGDAYSELENFYAPLALFLEKSSGCPICIDSAFFLVSNPLQLARFIDNWKKASIDLPEFTVSIIATDSDFDKFIGNAKIEGKAVLINPIFKLSGELVSGFVVENYYDLVAG